MYEFFFFFAHTATSIVATLVSRLTFPYSHAHTRSRTHAHSHTHALACIDTFLIMCVYKYTRTVCAAAVLGAVAHYTVLGAVHYTVLGAVYSARGCIRAQYVQLPLALYIYIPHALTCIDTFLYVDIDIVDIDICRYHSISACRHM